VAWPPLLVAWKGEFVLRKETKSVHVGLEPKRDPFGALQVPIYASTSYVFKDIAHAQRLFALEAEGFIYSRIGNPTVAALEARLAALEGALGAVAAASGHAAQMLAVLALAEAGDNLVASPNLYGGTVNQFKVLLARLGIEVRFVSREERPEEFLALTDERTRLWWTEAIGNPALTIPEFDAIAEAARKVGVAFFVDNTFGMGGALFNPLAHGAAGVIHSATKWIGGHGAVLGGAVLSGVFPWDNGRYPALSEPNPSYHGKVFTEAFGEGAFLARVRADLLRDAGAALGPFEAFLLLLGTETLMLRAERITENARALAEWLREHPKVAWVNYPGLEDHPHRDRAERYFGGRPGGVLTFGPRGGFEAAKRFIERVRLAKHLANVGDVRTLVIHPASTTHSQLDADALAAAGVRPEMVRVSVGIEHLEDLKADFDQALGG